VDVFVSDGLFKGNMSIRSVMVDQGSSSTAVSRGVYSAWVGAFVATVVFTALIWLFGANLQPFLDTLLPDRGASWYYWKLPARDFWTMFIV
jgi:hypothetical protein